MRRSLTQRGPAGRAPGGDAGGRGAFRANARDRHCADLFGWTPDHTENLRHLRLSSAIDRLNQKYGSETVSIGIVPTGLPGYMGAKIPFNRIPAREDFAG